MAEIFKTVIISNEIVRPGSAPEPCEPAPAEELPVHTRSISLEDLEHAAQEAYNKGYCEGLAEAEVKMADRVSQVTALLQNIPAAISDNRFQLSNEIADIVLLIIKQFFINQQQNKDHVALQINQIISQLNDKQNIELSLHPKDLTLLQQGQIRIDAKACKNLRITPDDNLRLGGCIVRSEHGVFDAGIERQIDNLKQVLLRMKTGEQIE